MLFTEKFRAFDNVVARFFSPSVHMACCKLLAVADSSTGITYVYYITLSSHDLQRVLKFQTFLRRRASAIVIDNERILFSGIEVGRKNVETVNRIATCCLELPIVASTNGYITIKLIKVDASDSLGIGLLFVQRTSEHFSGTFGTVSKEYRFGVLAIRGNTVIVNERNGQIVFDHFLRFHV